MSNQRQFIGNELQVYEAANGRKSADIYDTYRDEGPEHFTPAGLTWIGLYELWLEEPATAEVTVAEDLFNTIVGNNK